MSSPLLVSLYKPLPSHVPALACLAQDAFASDSHTQLKSLIKGSGFAEGMTPALESWLTGPPNKRRLIAATVRDAAQEQETIAGWVCWGCTDDGFQQSFDLPTMPPTIAGPPFMSISTPSTKSHTQDPAALSKIEELEALTNSHMGHYVDSLQPDNVKNAYILAIAVHPSAQGRGVGRALIEYGLKLAEAQNDVDYCWVSSSMGGVGMFKRMGFSEVVGREALSLDDYASGIPMPRGAIQEETDQRDEKWGSYVWWWLKTPTIRKP